MINTSTDRLEYSLMGLLVKTLLWLAAGLGHRSLRVSDEVGLRYREIERLKSENAILRKRLKGNRCSRHTWQERLHILWHMEVFNLPRRKVAPVFGIARSTYYWWLRQAAAGTLAGKRSGGKSPPNRTGDEIAALVWRIFDTNPFLGREKIAQMIQRLDVFLSPSAVRNILLRGRPKKPKVPESAKADLEESGATDRTYPGIVSKYPNHVWSVDLTIVKRWLLWPTYVLVGIDQFSRRIVCVSPLEGPNSGWTLEAFEQAILAHGKPKHLITDRGTVFTGGAFSQFLDRWEIQHRLGAVGKKGSVTVTERAIKTLKEEWLNRVTLIKAFTHLADLCPAFSDWYNEWWTHSTLDGATPNDVFHHRGWRSPDRHAKMVPETIDVRRWTETRLTSFRLKNAA
jgi:transposase InsO family protein